MIGDNIHFIAQLSVERLLNGVLEGTVVALFAWLLLRLIGRRNSGTRFAVWFCALLAIAIAPFLESSAAGTHAIFHAGAAITMPRAWSFYLFAAWAGIALVGLARVGVGLWHLRIIRSNCKALVTVGDSWRIEPIIARAIAESGRGIDVCVSDELRVPTAVGLVKPVVVIPAWALRELSAAELNAVVLHEVAHLRRWDDWTNLAQKLLRAVFFFHPAVWWVESQLSLEREMACDDMVLAQTENPRAYAECLVSLAEKNLLQRGVALAQAAVGRMRQTTARVLQILDPRRTKTFVVWKPAPWVVAGFSVICLVSAEHAPRLIAFGDTATASLMSTSSAAISTTFAAPEENSPFVPPVIPAAYHATAQASRVGVPATKADARRRFDRSSKPEPAIHQALHRVAPEPTIPLVHTAYAEDAPVVVMQQAVFVFVQDSPFGGTVPVVWRVRVWNLTVLPARPVQVGRELPSKSI